MGYYATASGFVKTRPLSEEECARLFTKLDAAVGAETTDVDAFNCVDISYYKSNGKTVIDFDLSASGNYHEDNVREFLKMVAPFTEEGEIEYAGEQNDCWRFHYRNEAWYEDNGYVSYKESEIPIKL